jgi:hypothetical protein
MATKLDIKAILVGFATMFGLAFLMSFALSIVPLIIPLHSFPTGDRLRKDVSVFLFIQELICQFSGGFITGWLAKRDQVKNAFALVVLDLVLARITTLFAPSGPILPLLMDIMMRAVLILCGAYLAKLAFRRMGL